MDGLHIEITALPIDLNQAWTLARSPKAGAVAFFVGTVRDNTQEKAVERLEYEAYTEMAVMEIEKIAHEMKTRWPVEKAVFFHRTGMLGHGEIAVVVAVATPHRAEAFEACRFAIDTLKQTVPIWKKEVYGDGETWVSATP